MTKISVSHCTFGNKRLQIENLFNNIILRFLKKVSLGICIKLYQIKVLMDFLLIAGIHKGFWFSNSGLTC
jgi:hypothetical protein